MRLCKDRKRSLAYWLKKYFSKIHAKLKRHLNTPTCTLYLPMRACVISHVFYNKTYSSFMFYTTIDLFLKPRQVCIQSVLPKLWTCSCQLTNSSKWFPNITLTMTGRSDLVWRNYTSAVNLAKLCCCTKLNTFYKMLSQTAPKT